MYIHVYIYNIYIHTCVCSTLAACTQAMRDARFRPDAPGAPQSTQEIAEWRLLAEEFFAQQDNLEKADAKKRPAVKYHRLATYDLICAMDWQMRSCINIKGWHTFDTIDTIPDHRIHMRYRATLMWDKGPDNMCATSYLLNHKKLRLSIFFSPTHGCQRAMWGGVQSSGKYALLLVATAVVNLERGPWHGEANWQMIRESTDEWKSKAGSDRNDPILRRVMAGIKVDKGEDPTDIKDQDYDDVVDHIQECKFYVRKPMKTALTQWNTLNDNLEVLFPEWSTKLIPLMHLGMLMGWCKPKASHEIFQALKPADIQDVKDSLLKKESTKVAHGKAKKLRENLPGAMKLATFAMLDRTFRQELEHICFATRVWRRFHGHLQKHLVSVEGSLKFHTDMVNRRGMFWEILVESMHPYRSDKHERLIPLGFTVSIDRIPLEAKGLDSTFMHEQALLARNLWRLTFGEIGSFLRNFIHYFDGFPGLFALFLDPDEAKRKEHHAKLQKEYTAFLEASKRPQVILQKIVKRSPMNWPDVLEMLTYNGREYSHDLHLNAERMFSHTGDSLHIEKHFQVKSDMCKDSGDLKISASTLWRGPVRQRVLSDVFKYGDAVSVADIADDMPAQAQLPQRIYENHYTGTSMNFRDLPSTKQSVNWERSSYETWVSLVTETKFYVEMHARDSFDICERAWRSQFFMEGLVVREKKGKAFVVLSYMPPMVVLWPVVTKRVKAATVYKFGPLDPSLPVYATMLAFEHWEIHPTTFLSPAHLLLLNGMVHFEEWPDAFAMVDGEWQPFLDNMAEHGFYDLGESLIDVLLVKEFDMASTGSFTDKLVALTRRIKGCDLEMALRCIDHRLAFLDSFSTEWDEVVGTEDFFDLCHDDDKEAATKYVERSAAAKTQKKQIQTEVFKKLRTVRAAKHAAGPKAKKPKAAAAKAKVKKVDPSPLPKDEALFTVEYVQGRMPHGCKVKQDIFNGRWQVWMRLQGPPLGAWRSFSRSWGCRAQSVCVLECARFAWAFRIAEFLGEECGITDLFADDKPE